MARAAVEAQREQVYHLPRIVQTTDSHERTTQTLDAERRVSPLTDKIGGELAIPDVFDEWTFELSPDHQLQLQTDLTTDWPINVGRSGMPEYFGGFFGVGSGSTPSLGQDSNLLETGTFNSDTSFS